MAVRNQKDIGGYTLVKRIGSGGMSTVFEAEDGAGNRVALKLLAPGLMDDPSARARLKREVATLQKVRGTNVAEVLDAETDEGEAFIVTELIDGPTLEQDVIDSGVYEGNDLAELATLLGAALDSVHSVGVVHRDLKPSNVMLGPEGPVLIDFGIALASEDLRLTAAGSIAHTPGYLDPRIINGAAPDEPADWWALAAVLVFSATGRAPFGSGSPQAVMRRVFEGDVDITGLPGSIASALKHALAPSLNDRLAFSDLVEILAGRMEPPDIEEPSESPSGTAESGRLADGAAAASVVGATEVLGHAGSAAADGQSGATEILGQSGIPGGAGATEVLGQLSGQVPADALDPGVGPSSNVATQVIDSMGGAPGVGQGFATEVLDPGVAGADVPQVIPPHGDDAGEGWRDGRTAILPVESVYPPGTSQSARVPSSQSEYFGGVVPADGTAIPAWLRPAPRSRLLVALVGAVILAVAVKTPFLGLTLYVALAWIASVTGRASVELNRRRLEHDGPYPREGWGTLFRLPWMAFTSALLTALCTSIAVVIGMSVTWMCRLVFPGSIHAALAAGSAVALLCAWLMGFNGSAKLGARTILRTVAPSTGYKLFWMIVLVGITAGVVVLTAVQPTVNWDPLMEAPFFIEGDPPNLGFTEYIQGLAR